MRKEVKKLLENAMLECREQNLSKDESIKFLVEYARVSILAAEDYYRNNSREISDDV